MYKDDRYHIGKVLEDIRFINDKMGGVTQEALQQDAVLCDSMMFRLIQISEQSSSISDDLKRAHKEIPWTDISGLRNRIVHDYGNVDLKIVYDALTKDIPELQELLEQIL